MSLWRALVLLVRRLLRGTIKGLYHGVTKRKDRNECGGAASDVSKGAQI